MFKELKEEEIKPDPLITGNDLIAMGLKPRPNLLKNPGCNKGRTAGAKDYDKRRGAKKSQRACNTIEYYPTLHTLRQFYCAFIDDRQPWKNNSISLNFIT